MFVNFRQCMHLCMCGLLRRMLHCSVTLLCRVYAMGPGHNPIFRLGVSSPLTGPHFNPARRKMLPGFFFQDRPGIKI